MHCCGIDHSHPHPTNATMFGRCYPPAEVASVGDNPFRIRQHLSDFVAKHLSSTLSFKKWKSDSPFKFGEALGQRRGRHAQRCCGFGEGFVISYRHQVRQLLDREIHDRRFAG
jgi:hypothetical protein